MALSYADYDLSELTELCTVLEEAFPQHTTDLLRLLLPNQLAGAPPSIRANPAMTVVLVPSSNSALTASSSSNRAPPRLTVCRLLKLCANLPAGSKLLRRAVTRTASEVPQAGLFGCLPVDRQPGGVISKDAEASVSLLFRAFNSWYLAIASRACSRIPNRW